MPTHTQHWSQYRPLNLMIGLAMSLSLTLCAFEYAPPPQPAHVGCGFGYEEELELILCPIQLPPQPKATYYPSIYDQKQSTDIQADVKSLIKKWDNNTDSTAIAFEEPIEKEEIQAIEEDVVESGNEEVFDFEEEVIEELDFEVTECEVVEDEEVIDCFCCGGMETNASPIGGMNTFYSYLKENISYPALAKKQGIEGKVIVQFMVKKTGKIDSVKIFRGIGGGCDEEVIRVISQAPQWNPGKQRGTPINQKMFFPVKFTLSD